MRLRDDESGRTDPNLKAIRTKNHLYVEHSNGERELYDLRSDPFQLENKYSGASPELFYTIWKIAWMRCEKCSGSSCKAAENRTANCQRALTTYKSTSDVL